MQPTLAARLSLLSSMFRRPRCAILVACAAFPFWLVYALSENIVSYYPKAFDLAIAVGQLGNPQLVSDEGWYYMGYLWFPNDHLQVTLLVGPVFFSVLLSLLFGLSIATFSYSVSMRSPLPRLGAAGVLGFVPALFSSSAPCCLLPFGSLIVAAVAPSTALATFTFTYGPLTSLSIAALMLGSLLYLSGRVVNSASCAAASSRETHGAADGASTSS